MNSRLVRSFAVIGLLMVAMFAAMTTNASAAKQDLHITDNNLKALMWWTVWTPYESNGADLATWPAAFNTYGGSKTLVYYNSIPAIKVRNGECVAFVNALANRNGISSDDWDRGINVMSASTDITRGTIIATFSDLTTYYGHVAIFGGYLYDSTGRRNGLFVWDQNYVPSYGGVVARHFIKTSNTKVMNAASYYVVQGPP